MSVATAVHTTSHTNGFVLPPPDKYRGAVVEVRWPLYSFTEKTRV